MLDTVRAQAAKLEAGWTARLELGFRRRGEQTFLARRTHVGPLVVQRPFYPEPGVCHVYVVHPPGGIVGGDELSIDVDAEVGSHALLTTPAATKFYRCESQPAKQQQAVTVENATVEWLPQETIFYPGAGAHSSTRISLTEESKFIGWELPCLGLPLRGEPFDRGRLHLDFELWIDGVPRWIDRLRIDGSDAARCAHWGLAGYEALGTMLIYPGNAAMLEHVRGMDFIDAEIATTLVDDVLVVRCLAAQAEPAKRAFVRVWTEVRPLLLGRLAHAPRIWAT